MNQAQVKAAKEMIKILKAQIKALEDERKWNDWYMKQFTDGINQMKRQMEEDHADLIRTARACRFDPMPR